VITSGNRSCTVYSVLQTDTARKLREKTGGRKPTGEREQYVQRNINFLRNFITSVESYIP